jgi:hypothetical protein
MEVSSEGEPMTTLMSRTVDDERDEARTANRGGVAFLLVHGITWLAAAILTFVLSIEQAALVVLFQGLIAFPASLLLERLLGFRFIPAKDNAVVSLFVLIAMTQGLSLPGSIIVLNLDPLYLPVAFAATNGGHFLPYMWLHRTRAYAVLAVVCALGPFAVLLVAGAATAFHATGFLVGGVMLAVAASIWTLRERGVAH